MNFTKFFLSRCSKKPISNVFGFDRGLPIDRYYIECFLNKYNHLIKGDVLEVAESYYTKKFGTGGVVNSKIISHVNSDNADYVGDLVSGKGVPLEVADCFIITQTLPVIYDLDNAIQNVIRTIRPNGYVLITVTGINAISRYDYERWGHFWAFTEMSVKKLLDRPEVESAVVESYGNVKSACAFLYGMAAHEVNKKDLDYNDNNYQVLITAVVKKR